MQDSSNSFKQTFNPTAKEFIPSISNCQYDSQTPISDSQNDSQNIVSSQCVWVGNVSPIITEEEFGKEFSVFGKIVLLRMFPKSKCAFVTYQDSQTAISSLALEGKLLGTMKLTLNIGMASRHLWVGNVKNSITDDLLRSAFSEYGDIESIRILRANDCAFINFFSEEDALRAAENLNGKQLGDETLLINFQWIDSLKKPYNSEGKQNKISRSNKNRLGRSPISENPEYKTEISANNRRKQDINIAPSPSRQLFIGNISVGVNEQLLYNLFSSFGQIENIKIFPNRGYAFVIFCYINHAIWAREQMIMYPPIFDGIPLSVNYGRVTSSSSNYSTSQSSISAPIYFVPFPLGTPPPLSPSLAFSPSNLPTSPSNDISELYLGQPNDVNYQ